MGNAWFEILVCYASNFECIVLQNQFCEFRCHIRNFNFENTPCEFNFCYASCFAVLLNETHFTFQSQNHFRVLQSAWKIGRGLKFGFDMELNHQCHICHISVNPFKVSQTSAGSCPRQTMFQNIIAVLSNTVFTPPWLMEFYHFVCMDAANSYK